MLNLTNEPELIDSANNELKSVNHQSESSHQLASVTAHNPNLDDNFLIAVDSPGPFSDLGMGEQPHLENLETFDNFDANNFDFNSFEYHKEISFEFKQPAWQSFWSITFNTECQQPTARSRGLQAKNRKP